MDTRSILTQILVLKFVWTSSGKSMSTRGPTTEVRTPKFMFVHLSLKINLLNFMNPFKTEEKLVKVRSSEPRYRN